MSVTIEQPRRLDRPRTPGDVVTQWMLPVVSLALLGFAGWFVWSTRPVTRTPAPPIAPAQNSYADALAASGIVEAQTENISAGSDTPGVVVEVLVTEGDEVRIGTPLFRLDDRDLRGELAVRQAAVAQAKSELVRLEAEVGKLEIELDRLLVRALVAGRVLYVNVRPGEFVGQQVEVFINAAK